MRLLPRFGPPATAAVALLVLLAIPSVALPHGAAGDDVAHRHVQAKGLKISMVEYAVPDLWLVRDDGKKVQLATELDDGRPQVLNFVYTTCPGICPLMSQVFSLFQSRMGADREKVHMVSISIDPEHDAPARLRDYAKRYSAGSQWRHYTGTVEASIAAQKAFNAYPGDKMSHNPLTLMRAAPGKPWVRIEGFATPDDLLEQYLHITARGEAGRAVR